MRSIHLLTAICAASAVLSTSLACAAGTTGTTGFASMSDAGGYYIKVGEQMSAPPPDLPGTTVPQPTGKTLQSQVVTDLQQRFNAAADPTTHLLSLAQAKSAGWGYMVTHFKEIDQDNKGYVSFDDFLRYLKSRNGPAFRS